MINYEDFNEPAPDEAILTASLEQHQYHITEDTLGTGGPKEKFKANVAAIKTLKQCEAEGRLATPEEQSVLARYVGWGGLPDAFDSAKDSWHTEYQQLKALLTEAEYKAARASTLTAFYTPPVVIKAMYQALEHMGFCQGNLLDRSIVWIIRGDCEANRFLCYRRCNDGKYQGNRPK